MAKIYKARDHVPEIQGKLHSSLTVAVDTPDELETVSRLCADAILGAGGLGETDDAARATLREIRSRLAAFDHWQATARADPAQYRQQLERALVAIGETAAPGVSARLLISLVAAQELWRNELQKGGKLVALVSIRPHWLGKSGIYYRAEEPALALYDGSWRCSLTKYVERSKTFCLNAGAFAIAPVRATVAPASIAAENIVQDLRATAATGARYPLRRLEQLQADEVKEKKGIILLLHGVFSTDAATFDGFIGAWQDDSEFGAFLAGAQWRSKCQGSDSLLAAVGEPDASDFRRAFSETVENDFLIVGWAHDTLTGIEKNATQLIRQLKTQLGGHDARIVLVCHSRGGLLARKVAVMADAELRQRLVGCVTFGTPHEGAPLAERRKSLHLVAALLMIGSASKNVLSVTRTLTYFRQEKALAGVDDLAPASVRQGDFLSKLLQEELQTAAAPGKERHLPILPVGGDFSRVAQRGVPWFKRATSFIMGLQLSGQHDLIVELSSSRPPIGFNDVLQGGLTADCDHSGYFEADQTAQQHFREVILKVREFLDFDAAVCARVRADRPKLVITPPLPVRQSPQE